MGISIKNQGVEDDIRRLAQSLGVDLTEAVRVAVHHELARSERSVRRRLRRMEAAGERLRALPVLDGRTPDELLDYDDGGLFS